MIDATKVIEAYNAKLPHGVYPRSIWRDEDVQDALRFIEWCNAHEVHDPALWIWMRFSLTKSRGYPSFRSLRSDVLLPHYRKLAAKQRRDVTVVQRGKGAAVRALIDVAPAHEAVRARYTREGKLDLCVLQPSLSGGYHPQSSTCIVCPRAVECAQRINDKHGFDVVALRLGRVDALPEHIRKVVGG